MANGGARFRTGVLVLVVALGASTGLSACGSGPSAATKSNVVKKACTKVNAALSDGPDPTSDPVGYAEAQIRPLYAIKTSDADVQIAINYLASTYRLFYQTNGSRPASNSVKAALQLMSVYCPGVGS